MQCPNCGKEALNVNGRFVCLDCGVEIAPETQGNLSAKEETTVNNHAPSDAVVNVASSSDNTAGVAQSVPEPAQPQEITPEVPLKETPSTPVQNEYLSELNKNSGEEEKPAEGNAIPDFPNAGNPSATVSGAAINEEVQKSEVNDLNITGNPAENNVNEKPESVQAPADGNYFKPETVDLSTAPAEPQEVPTSPTQPVSLPSFEPSQVAEQPEVAMPLKDQPVEPLPQSLPVMDEAEKPQDTDQPVQPVSAVNTSSSSLDDLLSQYSITPSPAPETATAMVQPPNPQIQPNPAFDSVMPTDPSVNEGPVSLAQNSPAPSAIPGAGNMPSTESVFGPQDQSPEMNVSGKSKIDPKKMILWGGVGLAALLLIGGAIFLGITLTRSKTTEDPAVLKQEQMLKYSELVGKAMDPNQNILTSFKQSLDFSKATVKTVEGGDAAAQEALKALFANAISHQGNWSTNTSGDISLDSTMGETVNKRIYIQADRASYVFSTELNSWTKIDDYQFMSVPSLYGVVNKGALFYTSKSDEISYVADEELDGVNYHKIRIKPKKEVFESLITGSSASLATAKIEEVTSDNLEVFAYINDEGKIHKVTATGDLGVLSDLFEGTVSVSSEATYDYKEVTIQRP